MLMSEEEQARLYLTGEIVDEVRYGADRFTEPVRMVIRPAGESRLLRLEFAQGLGEGRGNTFFDGEVPEVFETSYLHVREDTRYLTAEEMAADRPTLTHRVIDSDTNESVDPVLAQLAASLLERLNELQSLNSIPEVAAHSVATRAYLEMVVSLSESE